MSLDVVFAYLVGVLAGLAVIGALIFALIWEWCAIRRALAATYRLRSRRTSEPPRGGQAA
jgi:hypothetical protein